MSDTAILVRQWLACECGELCEVRDRDVIGLRCESSGELVMVDEDG